MERRYEGSQAWLGHSPGDIQLRGGRRKNVSSSAAAHVSSFAPPLGQDRGHPGALDLRLKVSFEFSRSLVVDDAARSCTGTAKARAFVSLYAVLPTSPQRYIALVV